jgi:hypothetical protein
MDLKYVGRQLLFTEEVCTWCQIPAKCHKPLHFRVKFLPGSWVRKVLFCAFKFLCIFEILPDRKFLYT